jgi:NADH:ubiquinone oxidoreductase subunit 4 (subunit M)
MFLAGISMKLGGYGCLRVASFLMPEAAHEYAWIIILLATIAILYGSFSTLMQTDLKYMNAYSSVSHCGFVLLGIGMLTKTAIMGAVMQMVSHGLMTALFFAAIGMVYNKTHTKEIQKLGGLLKVMPFISTVFVICRIMFFRFTRPKWFCCRNDCICWFLGKYRYILQNCYHSCLCINSSNSSLYFKSYWKSY